MREVGRARPPRWRQTATVLCAVGDLLDDVVVWLGGPIGRGTDTPAQVFHRRGGSAANVAAFAAGQGRRARFVGHLGGDPLGDRLLGELADAGVELCVRRGGRTGTVVVLVEPGGERTMLTDRGSATHLADVPPSALDDVAVLHLTSYALVVEPMATTAKALALQAHAAGATVSLDASSVRLLHDVGRARFEDLLAELRPDVLLANAAEAAFLGLPERLPDGVGLAVVKRGGASTVVVARDGAPSEVPVPAIDDVTDTTGAGDAFAAGFLGAVLDGADAVAAVVAGHELAAAVLGQPGATLAGDRR
jgi:sugar/nucleoside kinase (ribokinase family)